MNEAEWGPPKQFVAGFRLHDEIGKELFGPIEVSIAKFQSLKHPAILSIVHFGKRSFVSRRWPANGS